MNGPTVRLCFCMLLYSAIAGSVPIFQNGEYTHITVVIDGNVEVDKEQLEKLQKLIEAASQELYVATHGMAYFKKVAIAALETYGLSKNKKHSESFRTLFSNADIRIENANTEYGDNPFTFQAGECGEPGKYIRLTTNFFKDLDSENATKLAARLLVHEWAHYRYGVFDEHPIWDEEQFRWEREQISPATCADGIHGWAMTENLELCTLDCGRVRSNCKFIPDPKNNAGVESSLMSHPHLPDVMHFCNDSNHNTRALSMQNKMCNSRSIMEVIREHEDFNDAHRWLETMKNPKTDVIWVDLPSYEPKYFFFVVESSQVMEEENGTQTVQEFIQRFFMYLAPKGARATMVKFFNDSEILWYRVDISKKEHWQKDEILNESIPVGPSSATPHIGNALQQALEAYKHRSFVRFPNPTIFLISTGDGEVTEEQYRLVQYGDVLIHSIAIGRKSSWKLDRLSRMTGGDSYSLGEGLKGQPCSFNLDMAFLATMHSQVDDHLQPVVILYERFVLKQSGENRYGFRVDEGIGKDLVVTISRNDTGMKLSDPDGHIYYFRFRENDFEYGFKSTAKKLYVESEVKYTGRWELNVRRESNQEEYMDVMIMAKPRVTKEGGWIWVRAWIANATMGKKGTKGHHRIYAEVKKGYSPVINATVVATVEIPDQRHPFRVTLKDNGAAPDVFKDDGVYSNFFPVTKRSAVRPLVIVRVSNDEGGALMRTDCKRSGKPYGMLNDDDYQRTMQKFGSSKSRFIPKDFVYSTTSSSCDKRKEVVRFCSALLPSFTRAAMANSPILFEMSESEVRQTPPTAVRDLEVVTEFVRDDVFYAVLRWTSPEHPRPDAKVKLIEIRGSRNQDLMTSSGFLSVPVIAEQNLNLPAGEIQHLEVKISKSLVKDDAENAHNFYFALRASDEKGNKGEISNVAEAFFERTLEGHKEESKVMKVKAASAAMKHERGVSSWLPWTVGVVVVIAVFVFAVLASFGYWKLRNWMGF